MNLQEILADIHALEEDLLAFERKYGIRSEIFYPAYVKGEEPEDDSWVLDFGEWASVYRTWLANKLNIVMKSNADKLMLPVWRD